MFLSKLWLSDAALLVNCQHHLNVVSCFTISQGQQCTQTIVKVIKMSLAPVQDVLDQPLLGLALCSELLEFSGYMQAKGRSTFPSCMKSRILANAASRLVLDP